MNKLGVDAFHWTDGFSGDSLWIVTKAKSMGFDCLEIAVRDPDTFPSEELNYTASELGMDITLKTALPASLGPVSGDKTIRSNGLKHLKKIIQTAANTGANILAGPLYSHWGVTEKRPCTSDEWNRSLDFIREASEFAESVSDFLVLGLELVNRYETNMLNNVDDGIRYCTELNRSNVRLHLDTYHMIREETSIPDAFIRADPFLGYVHLSESTRGILGKGTVPWKEVLDALKKISWSGTLVFESFAPGSAVAHMCNVWKNHAESGEKLAEKNLKIFKTMYDENP